MIITKNIEKKVTQYNLRIFKKFGFSIGDIAVVDIKDWDRNSHEKVLVKCDICGIEKYNQYRQYMDSYEKYPTIDHKISVKSGFLSNISAEDISSTNNLCLTKRTINTKKNTKNENQFILSYS